MRVVDFFVFYITTLYKNKRRGSLFWDSPVGRTAFVVGFTFTMLLFSTLEIIFFLIAGMNIMDFRFIVIVMVVVVALIAQLLRYIYIVKKRYEYINSAQYKAFTLNRTVGVIICTTTSFLSLLLLFGIALAIHAFLKNHGNIR
jgi:hypothetical protein